MPDKSSNLKYIFVTGGVISGLGKGISTASIGLLLQDLGYNVSVLKADSKELINARLSLVEATSILIKKGLKILDVEVLEEM